MTLERKVPKWSVPTESWSCLPTMIKKPRGKNIRVIFITVCLSFITVYPFVSLYSLYRLYYLDDPTYTTDIPKVHPKQSSDQQAGIKSIIDKGDSEELTVKDYGNEVKEGVLFVPGSLNLTRIETFQRCYVDPDQYQHHFGLRRKRDEVSETYKLVYVQQAKAGSSSARHIMRKLFGDTEGKIFDPKPHEKDQFHRFTFTRDPMSRFLSSFHEALIAWNRKSYLPKEQGKFDFLRQFYALERRKRSHYVQFNERRITQMLEEFVREYDGNDVPEDHLRLQVPNLIIKQKKGEKQTWMPHLDAIYDIENMDEEFTKMWMASTAYNNNTKTTTVGEHKYKRAMHINASLISLETRRKICQLSALDFCCLNHRLPPECEGVVGCQWRRHPDQHTNSSSSTLAITALSPYPSL